jgi:hypothetical protein
LQVQFLLGALPADFPGVPDTLERSGDASSGVFPFSTTTQAVAFKYLQANMPRHVVNAVKLERAARVMTGEILTSWQWAAPYSPTPGGRKRSTKGIRPN